MQNRQWGSQTPHDTQAIKPARSSRAIVGTVMCIVGASLFVPGIFTVVLSFFFTNTTTTLSLLITGGSLILPGIIMLIIAACFRRAARREQANLARLKDEGHSFSAEIIRTIIHPEVRINHSVSASVECSYQNREGKTCLVKSRTFLYKNHENYSAMVYVNPIDPSDYAVEVFTLTPHVKADYDYR